MEEYLCTKMKPSSSGFSLYYETIILFVRTNVDDNQKIIRNIFKPSDRIGIQSLFNYLLLSQARSRIFAPPFVMQYSHFSVLQVEEEKDHSELRSCSRPLLLKGLLLSSKNISVTNELNDYFYYRIITVFFFLSFFLFAYANELGIGISSINDIHVKKFLYRWESNPHHHLACQLANRTT